MATAGGRNRLRQPFGGPLARGASPPGSASAAALRTGFWTTAASGSARAIDDLPEPDGPKIASGRVALGLLRERLQTAAAAVRAHVDAFQWHHAKRFTQCQWQHSLPAAARPRQCRKARAPDGLQIRALTTGSRQGPQGGTLWQAFGVDFPLMMTLLPSRWNIQRPRYRYAPHSQHAPTDSQSPTPRQKQQPLLLPHPLRPPVMFRTQSSFQLRHQHIMLS